MDKPILNICYLEDSNNVVVLGEENKVAKYNFKKGKTAIYNLDNSFKSKIQSIEYLEDSENILFLTESNCTRYNIRDKQLDLSFNYALQSQSSKVLYIKNLDFLVFSSKIDNTVIIVHLESKTELHKEKLNYGFVDMVYSLYKGIEVLIICESSDGFSRVYLLDLKSFKMIRELRLSLQVAKLEYLYDNQSLMFSTNVNSVSLTSLDKKAIKEINTLLNKDQSLSTCPMYLCDGRSIMLISTSGEIEIWECI